MGRWDGGDCAGLLVFGPESECSRLPEARAQRHDNVSWPEEVREYDAGMVWHSCISDVGVTDSGIRLIDTSLMPTDLATGITDGLASVRLTGSSRRGCSVENREDRFWDHGLVLPVCSAEWDGEGGWDGASVYVWGV